MASLRSLLSLVFGLFLLASPAKATWSIVIVDLATGEVAIGIATCLENFDLRPSAVVVVPGHGAAAAQSFIGPISLRELIRSGLLDGTSASQILADLAAADAGHQTRQYGIVSVVGGEETFTGTSAGPWAGGVVGQVGMLRYAIQGNVLTGAPVVNGAEQAVLNTPGTIGDKLMAAMQAARSFGGDGRCSCVTTPTGCGSPPPSFTKSAHIGLMILSRPSDIDAPCTPALGCAAGDYWMDLNVANQTAADPDPVLQLQGLYDQWKLDQIGRPDHFQSTLSLSDTAIRSNGIDEITGTVVLRDAQGNPLGNSLPLSVALRDGSTVEDVVFDPGVALPDGSYQFTMRGAFESGDAILDVSVTDQFGRVGIWPQPVVTLDNAFGPCGDGAIPDAAGLAFDALRVEGTGGGTDRVVDVGLGQPFTIALDAPGGTATSPLQGVFALWAHAGAPPSGTELPVPGGGSALCFTPAPFAPAPTFRLADSFGFDNAIVAGPAPWSFPIPSVPVLADVVLQGAMVVDTGPTFAATNAILLRITELPAPRIDAIVPQAPLAGQTVTVDGVGFFQGLAIDVDGIPTTASLLSETQFQFTMPAGIGCDATLTATNLGAMTTQETINGTPLINTNPSISGPAAGGAQFVIVGLNLGSAVVTIGGQPLNVASQGPTFVLGTTPPGSPGPATVLVETPTGCSTTTTYTYQ